MSRKPFAFSILLLSFLSLTCAAAQAATITVNSTANAVNSTDGLCTLPEAIVAANTNTASGAVAGECLAGDPSPTVDVIVFALSGAGCSGSPVVCTIAPTTDLPQLLQDLTIDGGNNGVATNRVQISGGGTLNSGLIVNVATNTTIRNLVINGFTSRQILVGNSNGPITIQGNFLGTNPAGDAVVANSAIGVEAFNSGVVVGGTTAAARNVITSASGSSAIAASGGSTTVQGNFIGLNAAGTAHIGNPGTGVAVDNAGATVGGTAPGAGNVIVAFTGIRFAGNPALGHSSGSAQGNFIGTDVTGTTALNLGNGAGVSVEHATGVLISGNLISGNGEGVLMSSSGISGATSDHTTVQNNRIGTAADGVTALGNTRTGVSSTSSLNLIGGINSGEGNIIAFNGEHGVLIGNAVGNTIWRNSIFSNGGLGINLAGGTENPAGVTSNDQLDPDVGSNNLQNYPVMSAVTFASGNVMISGSLNSTANTPFRLEFFASTVCDPSLLGEGRTFLGSQDVLSNVNGNAFFNVTFPSIGGQVITVTATSNPSLVLVAPGADTSEFSVCSVPIVPPAPPTIAKSFVPSSITVNGTSTLTFTINNTATGNGALTSVAFTDTFPAGVVVATPNGLTGTCGGGTITANAGSGAVSLSGAALAAGASCSFSVNVTATSTGTKTNTTGPITSTESGPGSNASADLIVTALPLLPPVITKNFLLPTIQAGAGSQVGLHFTINNPNPQDPSNPLTNRLTGVGFTDTLPAGLILFTPPGLVASCSGVTATGGGNTITMSGGTVGAGLTCTIDVTINAPAGTTPGLRHNVTSNVTSTEAGAGNSASSDITVQAPATTPPSLSKQFGAASIAVGASTTLTFTITNGNGTSLTNVAFSDTLPAGLVVSTPNGLTGSCGGGTITALAGTSVVSLSGATLTASQQCQFGVSVTGTTAGPKNNTTGAISSTESGAGGAASASLTVASPVTPTLGTTPTPASGTLGLTRLNDQATLSGGSNPTGTITFRLFSPADSSCAGTAFFTQTVSVSGNGTVSTSGGPVANAIGIWHWTASYSGDPNNNAVSSACAAESVVIGTAQTELRTTPTPARGTVGVTLNDQATLQGVNPTGTITFSLFSPTDPNCLGAPFFTQTVPVSGNGTVSTSGGPVANAAGTWQWTVSYSGDANNSGADGTCGAEPVVVSAVSGGPIPTLSEWGMIMMAAGLAWFAMRRMRRAP